MKLLQNQLKDADFIRTVWSAQPEPGTTLEEMLTPEFWAHTSRSLKKDDVIEVRPKDGLWFAELYVRSANDNAATVFVLRHVVFAEDKKVAEGTPFEIKHRGPRGWSVQRRSDKVILFENGATRDEAEAWITSIA